MIGKIEHRQAIIDANKAYREALEPIIQQQIEDTGGNAPVVMGTISTEVYSLATSLSDRIMAECVKRRGKRMVAARGK